MRICIPLMSLCLLSTPVGAETTDLDTVELKACAFVDPPEIIDGSYASRPGMAQMGKDVRIYAADIQASLACLDVASQDVEPEHALLIKQIYNNGVDQLNFIVERSSTSARSRTAALENSGFIDRRRYLCEGRRSRFRMLQ